MTTTPPPSTPVTYASDVDFAGPKNGEDCDACKGDLHGICLYHRGYDDGWAAARSDAPFSTSTAHALADNK